MNFNLTRTLATLALAAFAATTAPLAHAANHALILWIGDYGNKDDDLPGIDIDAAMAKEIALAMGVPANNINELRNRDFTKANVVRAFSDLAQRMGKDDKVFIYYSGHGAQVSTGGGCMEGMVTRDPALFEDARLQEALTQLGNKASQVVMLNDSCFSGGAATKSREQGRDIGSDGEVPKFYGGRLPASAVAPEGHRCGDFVNKVTRNLQAVPRPPQVLYLAAAAANEVSFATKQGSTATVAWKTCMRTGDADNSGAVDGKEMQACAQKLLDNRRGRRQTITLVGNGDLPLTFTSSSNASAGAGAAVNPVRMLENLRAQRDPSLQVRLQSAQPTLRIGQDFLDFSVNTSIGGYLYVLHVGSDGKTLDVLFPNKLDTNNRVNAGTTQLPRQNWRVKAAGPAGNSYVMAVVSPVPKDFTKDMDTSSTFANAPATERVTRNLVVESSGTRLGISEVVAVRETN